MSHTCEDVKEDFETYGIIVDCAEVLNKCLQLCKNYTLSSEQIAVSWLSYSSTRNLDELTLDALGSFERDELRKGDQRVEVKEAKGDRLEESLQSNPSQTIYTASTLHLFKPQCDEDDLLAAYGASPYLAKEEKLHTPSSKRQVKAKRDLAFQNSLEKAKNVLLPSVPLSPACSSPSQKYSSRVNSGQVVCSFGADVESADWEADFSLSDIQPIEYACGGDAPLLAPYKHMFEKLRDSGEILDDYIHYLGDQLREELSIEDWSSLNIPSNEAVWCIGRICCDSVGKLNSASVLLEGSREHLGQSVQVDLSRVSSFALFPGQIVAIKGINSSGSKLMAEEMVCGKVLNPPQQAFKNDIPNMQIKVACGPFTTRENLLYEPLEDFLSTVVKHPPHILVLLGPLLDLAHPLLDSANDTYDSIVSNCLSKISTALQETETQVFIVASLRDVSCPMVYPTPPVILNGSVPQGGGQIKILSDPALLDFNGFLMGITATDVLMHISKEEISFPPQSGDRMARLSQHLLKQQSFYPLYPPPDGLCMNLEQADVHTRLPFTPHMMVLPSDLRGFIKDVSNCVIVNPERLSKGTIGGSFAQLQISPPTAESKRFIVDGKILKI